MYKHFSNKKKTKLNNNKIIVFDILVALNSFTVMCIPMCDHLHTKYFKDIKKNEHNSNKMMFCYVN